MIPDQPKQVILGVCPSKSNCYRIAAPAKDKGFMYKTDSLKQYEKNFTLQCNLFRGKKIDGLFRLYLHVYYPSNRSDLDNSLKVVLDCLQVVEAIKNDNLCMSIQAEKYIDKANPRIEFQIIPV